MRLAERIAGEELDPIADLVQPARGRRRCGPMNGPGLTISVDLEPLVTGNRLEAHRDSVTADNYPPYSAKNFFSFLFG